MTRNIAIGPDSDGCCILADDGKIEYLGTDPADAESAERDRLDCSGTTLEPGRVNAHTHIYSGLAPLGLPLPEKEPEDFPQILEQIWWRLDRALEEGSLRAAARLYVAEALLAGTTTLIDHHESPNFIEGSLDVLADICQEMGIRAVLCYGATERNGGRDEAKRGLAECRRFIVANDRPLIRGVVALHASFTVSDATVREAGELCRELGTVLHVHMAEDAVDVRDAQERGYPGPLERLLELGALPPGSILAHGVHLTEEQVRLAYAEGLWFVQNPRSNRGNRVGYPRFLGASNRVALGTDGYPARMDEEIEALWQESRANHQVDEKVEPRIVAGHRLISELFDETLAPLSAGGAADIIARSDQTIVHTIIGGRVVVRDGRLVSGDWEQIASDANRQASPLWDRMGDLPCRS